MSGFDRSSGRIKKNFSTHRHNEELNGAELSDQHKGRYFLRKNHPNY
jgi:hypothetical protein